MTFPVEIVLKGQNNAVKDSVVLPGGDGRTWTDALVREALVEILRSMARAEDPKSPRDREVILQGFSWIVEPEGNGCVLAIEIPMGAAVAGPFSMAQAELDAMITRVLRAERQMRSPGTVH